MKTLIISSLIVLALFTGCAEKEPKPCAPNPVEVVKTVEKTVPIKVQIELTEVPELTCKNQKLTTSLEMSQCLMVDLYKYVIEAKELRRRIISNNKGAMSAEDIAKLQKAEAKELD